MNELIAGPLDYYLGGVEAKEGRALGTSGNASPGPVGYNGDPKTIGGIRGEHREAGPRAWSGKPSAGKAWVCRDAQSSCERWLFLSTRGALIPGRPLRATILSRVRGDSGAQFHGHPRTHCGPCAPLQSGPVTQGGERRYAGAAWLPNPRCPACRGALQRHGLGRPGHGHARPRPGRPPAWSPGRSQPARPRPGGGVGRGVEPGPWLVSGCSWVTVTCRAWAGLARRLHILGSEEEAGLSCGGVWAQSSGGRRRTHVAAAAVAAPAAAAAAAAHRPEPPAVFPPSALRQPLAPSPLRSPAALACREPLSFSLIL